MLASECFKEDGIRAEVKGQQNLGAKRISKVIGQPQETQLNHHKSLLWFISNWNSRRLEWTYSSSIFYGGARRELTLTHLSKKSTGGTKKYYPANVFMCSGNAVWYAIKCSLFLFLECLDYLLIHASLFAGKLTKIPNESTIIGAFVTSHMNLLRRSSESVPRQHPF